MAFVDLFGFPHFYLIFFGVLFFTIGVVFVLIHKPKEWYKFHLWFMVIGMILSLIGIIILRGISSILHAYFGITSGVLLIAMIVLGIFARTLKKNRKNLRLFHIWGGRIAYLFVLVTLVYGIILFL